MFSIVIPLVKDHDVYIPKLFATLSIENDQIVEIIIARSHLPANQADKFERYVNSCASDVGLANKVVFENSEYKQNAAQNRNAGGSRANSDWICFLDADDEYSEYRLRYLSLIIRKYPEVNLILHSYTYKSELQNWSMPANLKKSIDQVEAETQDFSENKESKNSNLTVPLKNTGNNRIHHGHITVKKKVFQETKFLIDQPGQEDGLFCNVVLSEHGNVKYFPLPLSIYNVERSATNKSPYKRLVEKFLKFFQK
jgi:hypothetical protein